MMTPLENEKAPGPKVKKVAVIGAGPSGLAAVKSLMEEGHQVICFEKARDIGGVYRWAEDNNGVYDSAYLTSSSFITAFSDFPPRGKVKFHFKHDEYLQYLRDYATDFGSMPFIKFNHAVQRLEQSAQGAWVVKVLDQDNKKEEQYTFDAVAVCAGVHQNISIPVIPHSEIFQGKIIHSGHYKRPDAFKGKNVVVVGGGESGSDIVDEVSRVTGQCALVLRRGVLVLPRFIFSRPNDFYTNRLFYTSPVWLFRIRHESFHWPTFFVILCIITAVMLVFEVLNFILVGLISFFPILGSLEFILKVLFIIYLLIKMVRYLSYVGIKELIVISQLNFQSQAGHDQQFATKCQGIAKAIASKKCFLKKNIKEFTKSGVIFEDDTAFEADAVIFCTGYVTRYPFLGIERMDCRNLYKNCFDPKIGPTLCFIGLARPARGAIPPIAEMQSRWFAQILSGNVHLPSAEDMQARIKTDARNHQEMFSVVSDRITGLVDYTSYMDELAGFIGCRPLWKDLKKDPILLYRIYYGPFIACQYRLFGPHSNKEQARKTMGSISVDLTQNFFNFVFMCSTIVCKILFRMGFKYFEPNLPL